MAVITDIVDGNGARLTQRGWEFERIYFISDLVTIGSNMMVEAVATAGVSIGDQHPSIPFARVLEILPESIPTAGNQAKITYNYVEFAENYEYELTAGQSTKVTDKYYTDNTGAGVTGFMTVGYTYPEGYLNKPDVIGEEDFQALQANIFIAKPKIIISRTELLTIDADNSNGYPTGIPLTGNILTDRNLKYANKLNLSGWNIRPTDPEGQWLCDGIGSGSADNGISWRVRYTFTSDKDDLWVFTGNFLDPVSGLPEPDATLVDDGANGKKEFDMYLLRNFSLLGLR